MRCVWALPETSYERHNSTVFSRANGPLLHFVPDGDFPGHGLLVVLAAGQVDHRPSGFFHRFQGGFDDPVAELLAVRAEILEFDSVMAEVL